MTRINTAQVALYGALTGAAAGTLSMYLQPGRNDVSLAWVWIGMAATCALVAAAGAGGFYGAWNFVARRLAS